jgi:sugar-specific transcriptional regulator TrmB
MKTPELELLGLNKYESLAYESLARLGKSSAPEISRESGVPYGRIYDTLNSMINKHLIQMIPENTSKKYVLGNPKILRDMLKKRRSEIDVLSSQIEDIQKSYRSQEAEAVMVIKGKRNFYNYLRNRKRDPKLKESRLVKFSSEYNPEWVRGVNSSLRAGKKYKVLANVTESTSTSISRWRKVFGKRDIMRKFNQDSIAMTIEDKELWVALTESNTLLIVRDKAFIDVMKRFFDSTWETSDKI